MKSSSRIFGAWLAAAFVFTPVSHAQTPAPAAAKPMSVFVSVENTSENRNSSSSSLNLSVSIFTEGVRAGTRLNRTWLTRAVDDAGRNVAVTPTGSGWGYNGGLRIDQQQPLRVANPLFQTSLSLSAPSRTATMLAEVEGNVELFVPSETNGSLVRLPNIASHEGLIESPALTRLGIALRRLTAETWKDYAGSSFFSTVPDFTQTVVLQVQDPKGTLTGLEFQDQRGSPLPPRVTSSGSGPGTGSRIALFTFGGALPPEAQLVLTLAIPEALTVLPFKILKVPLP